MHTWFRWIACTMTLTVLLTGPPATGARATIQFWYADEGWVWGEALINLAREFELDNPQIAIQTAAMVSGTKYEEAMITNVVAGTAPDIAFFNRTRVIERGAQGIFEPLNRLIDPTTKSVLNPMLLQETTLKGTIWAVPLSFDLRGLFWNNRLLEESGLDSHRGPVSLEELRAFAVRLTRFNAVGDIDQLGFFPRGNNWQIMGWFFTFGGEIFNWETGLPDVVKPQNVQALEWVRSYTEIVSIAEHSAFLYRHGNDIARAFVAQSYALMPGPSANVASWRRDQHDLDFSVGRVPHPPGGRNGTWSGGASIVIPRGSKNVAAASQFLNFLLQPESQLSYFNASLNFPVNRVAMARIQTRDQAMLAFASQADELNPRPPLWGPITNTLSSLRDRVMKGEVAPSPELLEQAQAVLEAQAREAGLGD